MALRGERVGTAYVRILADGSGLNKSIADEIADSDSEELFEQQGQKDSKAYGEGFESQNKAISDKFVRNLVNGIQEQSGKYDRTVQQLNADVLRRVENQFRTRFGVVGEQMVANLREGFLRSGGSTQFLEGFVENLSEELATATLQFNREWEDRLNEAHQMNVAFDRERLAEARRVEKEAEQARLAALRDMYAEAYQMNADFNARVTLANKIARQEEQAQIVRLRGEWNILRRAVADYHKGVDQTHGSRRQLLRSIKDLSQEFALGGILTKDYADQFHRLRREVITTEPAFFRIEHSISRFADSVARGFGKGSRNDFLNFMGSMIGNMARLPNLFFSAASVVYRFGSRIAEVASERGPLAALGTALGGLVKVGGGVGAAFAGMFVVIGPIMALMSQLAGIVTALASSIGFALVGALAALPAVILPAAAGVSVLALAFYDLEKAEKKALKADIKPVIDSFGELADAARARLFDDLGDQAERFAGVIDSLQTTFRRLGGAVSDVVTGWIDGMESPAFGRFVDLMAIFLPEAVRSLGRIVGNVFGGLGGLLTGMIPVMRDVLSYLERITGEFSDWVNTTEGQAQIVSFFDDATDSLSAFWDFLNSVGDLLGELMTAGREAGDSLFGSMADAIDGWVATIKANPDILQDWFDSARSFGEVLGTVFEGLGKVFSALDNEFSRAFTTTIFEAFAGALDLIATSLETVARLLGIGEDDMLGFVGQVAAAAFILPKLRGALAGINGAMTGFIGNSSTAVSKMSGLANAAKTAAGVGGMVALTSGMNQSNDAAGILLSTLGGAATGFAFGGPWGALIGGAAGGALSLFSDSTDDATESVEKAAQPVLDYAATFDTLTGSVTAATEELVYQDLLRSGAVARAKGLGVSIRDLVGATMGERDALARVNESLSKSAGLTAVFTDALGRTITVGVDSKKQLRELTEEYAEQGYQLDSVKSKMLDDTARKLLLEDIGAITNEWRAASKATRQEILATQDLSSLFKKLPKKIATKIDATGIVPTARGVAKVAEQYDLVDRGEIKALIEAVGIDASVKDVQRVLDKLTETDRKETNPKIGADDDSFKDKMRVTAGALAGLGRTTVTPKINVDNSGAAAGISETERWLNSIQDEIVYVNVERRSPGVQEHTASGGIFSGWQQRIIGEEGPEAVVPLNRPLSQVDPAVRWLSAIAQGLTPGGAGKVVEVGGITIVSPNADPHAVAVQTVNELVASAYF